MTKTRIYCLRPTSGDTALIRAATPAAAVRHWADSMLASVAVASQDDIVEVLQAGGEVETAGEDAAEPERTETEVVPAEGWPFPKAQQAA